MDYAEGRGQEGREQEQRRQFFVVLVDVERFLAKNYCKNIIQKN